VILERRQACCRCPDLFITFLSNKLVETHFY
jgi:hypothetical protein